MAGGFFILGLNAGATGTYNLSGTGSLVSSTDLRVGSAGTGFFNQTGGTNNINGGKSLYLGYAVGGVGT